MSSPHSPASESGPERASILALIEQLQASRSWKAAGPWGAFLAAGLYGVIAAIQGREFFIFYCGVLVVVLMLHAFGEQRTRWQIDLLVQMVRELEKKEH